MPTSLEVAAYSRAQKRIVSAARSDLRVLWSKLDQWSVDDVRDGLERIYPALVADYGDSSAALGAEWFEHTTGKPALAAAGVSQDQALRSMRWSLGGILAGNPAQALATLGGVTDRLVRQSGRNTVVQSARRSRVRWARIPDGNACAFCLMVSSKGAVFRTEETAGGMGNDYHALCGCEPVAVNDESELPEDYHPGELYSEYREARGGLSGSETYKILANMREQLGVR